jgi:hypothetical protein
VSPILTTRTARRLLLAAAMVAVSLSVSGCFIENRTNLRNVSQQELSAGGEPYFDAGPVTYQVQLTRALNPFSTEDVQYLSGIAGAQQIPADELWFGVFLWAKNQTSHNVTTTDTFKIVDSEGTVYQPVTLNPSINPYAWTSQTLAPDGIEPAADTTASYGPTQGGLILFKLNDSVYANRPLTLEIYAPGQSTPSRVSLDL